MPRNVVEPAFGHLEALIVEMRKRSSWTKLVWNVIVGVAFSSITMTVFWDHAHDPSSWRSSFFGEWEVSKERHPELLSDIRKFRQLMDVEPEDLWYPPDSQGWKKCSKPLTPLPGLPEKPEGYIQVFLEGGLNQQRMGVCDAVAIAKILNATLVLPHFDVNPVWRDSSMFADIFDVDHFIHFLENEVRVVKELPDELSWSTREYYATGVRATRVKDAPAHAGHMWYMTRVLSVLQTYGVAAIAPFTHRLGFEDLPPGIQQLRCRVNFEALRFVPKIQILGDLIIQRLHHNYGSQEVIRKDDDSIEHASVPAKFLALHLRFDKDMAAHSTCDFGGGVAERRALAKYRQIMWQGRVPNEQFTENEIRHLGRCPLTPEELAIMLAGLGFSSRTRVYLASHKVYGGEARMAHLRNLFPNMFDKLSLATEAELEPFKDRSSQLAALDYHVCLHSDAFISASRGNMHNALLAHRAYEHKGVTIKPDMVLLQELFWNSTVIGFKNFQQSVRSGHQSRRGQITLRKNMQSIYTYPAPDCMCGPGSCVLASSLYFYFICRGPSQAASFLVTY
ncbi:hypothetical protein R1sor_003360 [Riccia sorocarpa]|uniref:O-fucosyltransferase family protein n=1 Tax=Riccia sorocarpa TaxID=122646 RepID=A0ABD3H1D1_9MARC